MFQKGKRYESKVKYTDWGPGQKRATAQFGSQYEFITEDGEKLYWDTRTVLDKTVGDEFVIKFSVLSVSELMGEPRIDISRVKIIEST